MKTGTLKARRCLVCGALDKWHTPQLLEAHRSMLQAMRQHEIELKRLHRKVHGQHGRTTEQARSASVQTERR